MPIISPMNLEPTVGLFVCLAAPPLTYFMDKKTMLDKNVWLFRSLSSWVTVKVKFYSLFMDKLQCPYLSSWRKEHVTQCSCTVAQRENVHVHYQLLWECGQFSVLCWWHSTLKPHSLFALNRYILLWPVTNLHFNLRFCFESLCRCSLLSRALHVITVLP